MNSPYFIEPFVDQGLGNSAYLIGSHDTKKGILIDPRTLVLMGGVSPTGDSYVMAW